MPLDPQASEATCSFIIEPEPKQTAPLIPCGEEVYRQEEGAFEDWVRNTIPSALQQQTILRAKRVHRTALLGAYLRVYILLRNYQQAVLARQAKGTLTSAEKVLAMMVGVLKGISQATYRRL